MLAASVLGDALERYAESRRPAIVQLSPVSNARDYLAEQIETAGINYFVCDIAFGTMTFEEAMRTTTLLVQEVLPTFNSAAP